MLNKITKIFHTADIHCRTYKRHKEYKAVFTKFFDYVRENKDEGSVIVLAGDIVHSKLEMSPELIDLVTFLFKGCTDLCPTVVILGNHDCNLNNKHRRDALSPIVDALNLDNLHYWKDSGVYTLGDVDFAVMGILEDPSTWPTADQCTSSTKVAMYHGPVNGSLLDSNIQYHSSTEVKLFNTFDFTLLGDIHKYQTLSSTPLVQYPGSLIQQNFGEGLVHGFLEWDVATRRSKYIPIHNDWGYVTLNISNGKLQNNLEDYKDFKHLRARLKYEKTSVTQLNKIIGKLSKKFSLSELIYHRISDTNVLCEPEQIASILGDVRDVDYQNQLIAKYLKARGVTKKEIDQVCQLNKENEAQVPSSPIRFQVWKPKKFEFSNMFSYGPDNVVDFTNFEGIYGLFAPNASGKSALLDSFVYCLYDKSSRAFKAKHILNNKKQEFYCRLAFEIAGSDYFIERIGIENGKGDNVKVEVNFWTYDIKGVKISLNGKDRDETNKIIREYIGTYEDFVLTSLSTQNDNQSFIDKSQRERKELLYKFLDLSIFDSLYKSAKEQIRELQVLSKDLKKIDNINQISENRVKIDTLQYELKQVEQQVVDLSKEERTCNKMILDATKKLVKVNSSLNIDQATSETSSLRRALESLTSQGEVLHEEKQSLEKQVNWIKEQIAEQPQIDLQELKSRSVLVLKQKADLTKVQLSLQGKINSCNEKIEHLSKHEYDPNCEYCVKNPFVVDAQKAQHQLIQLLAEQDFNSNAIGIVECDLSKVEQDQQRAGKLQELLKLEQETEYKLLKNQNNLANLERSGLDIVDQLKQLSTKIEQYRQNEQAVLLNKQHTAVIKEQERLQLDISKKISKLRTDVSSIKGNIQYSKQVVKQLQSNQKRIEELESKTKAYEHYIEALSRDGVVYELLKRSIPVIENEVNDILNQLVDFRIRIEALDDSTINGYIVYGEDQQWPVELTSGMERFILSVALRVAMMSITSLSRANFLALDEGFGVLDSEKISSIYLLFEYLKTEFQFILCISHIDGMKDLADHLIAIEKDDKHSRVFVE